MLKLETLEISGFKSFVDPVDLTFSNSITGVVGPNGCGKSNVADAVTWVLGERSAKALRADVMDDVIFAGAAGRKPLGMAEVTLELATDPAFPHSQEGRLTIGRRVYRDGDSTFLINGKAGRLKDIKDLLAGTGLGLRAYSVIEQGKIDLILSGKPQERRRLLEEAAGVTKYRNRRHLTQLKLEEAVGNLNRLDDIVSEVERGIRSLKRQAGAARRYKQRKIDHEELLRTVLHMRGASLQQRLAQTEQELGALQDTVTSSAGDITGQEARVAELREAADQHGRQVSEHHREEAELAAAIQGRQEFLQGSKRTIAEIDERVAANQRLIKRTRAEVDEMGSRLKQLETVRTETLAARSTATDLLTSSDDLLSGAEKLVAQEQAAVEECRAALLDAFSTLSGERNRLNKQKTELEKGQFRLRRVQEERQRRSKLLSDVSSELKKSAGDAQSNRDAEDQLRQKLEREVEARSTIEERGAQLRSERSDLERQISRTSAALEFLIEASQEQAGRRVRIENRLEQAGVSNASFLADRISARKGWERAVDFFLDRLGDALVSDEDNADDLVAVLGSGEGSSAIVLPSTREHAAIDDKAILMPLSDALGLKANLGAALPPAYLVKSWSDARRLAEAHPTAAFLCQDGRWLQGRVLRVLGAKAQPGAIAREKERQQLETELPRLKVRLEDLESKLTQVDEDLQANAEATQNLRGELEAAHKRAAVAVTKEEEALGTKTRLTSEVAGLDNEKVEVEREIQRLQDSIDQHQKRVTELEERHQKAESAFDKQQGNLDQAREKREDTRASGASRRGALDVVVERLIAAEREIERLGQDRATADDRIGGWNEEAAELAARKERLLAEIQETETKLQAALEQKAELENQGGQLRDAWESVRQNLSEVERELAGGRTNIDQQRAALADQRVREASLRERLEHVQADHREHFGADLPEEPSQSEEPLEELEEQLESLRSVLERMGPVNELAAEELEEQQERHGFLTEQRTDVLKSIDSLRSTIAEIDETSSKRFLATFEAVNRHFSGTFAELFAGGEAEMRLMDEDNVLESGIEIVARPPGKRLQNLMLMSGGEKALTALALLFALFRHMPSPFCILDEVDAPLDDLNCLRFIEMLKRMAAETQFIVITHNKLTMEAASTLYGVTMAERGVSKVVAVELDEIDVEIEAAAAASA